MSRIAKAPITIPEGVNITQAEGCNFGQRKTW